MSDSQLCVCVCIMIGCCCDANCSCSCVCVSVPVGVLAALHLCVSLRDVQWSADSGPDWGALRLAGSDQRFAQPVDHLPDPDVSGHEHVSHHAASTQAMMVVPLFVSPAGTGRHCDEPSAGSFTDVHVLARQRGPAHKAPPSKWTQPIISAQRRQQPQEQHVRRHQQRRCSDHD